VAALTPLRGPPPSDRGIGVRRDKARRPALFNFPWLTLRPRPRSSANQKRADLRSSDFHGRDQDQPSGSARQLMDVKAALTRSRPSHHALARRRKPPPKRRPQRSPDERHDEEDENQSEAATVRRSTRRTDGLWAASASASAHVEYRSHSPSNLLANSRRPRRYAFATTMVL
jgi:hypothetical protein